MRDWNAMPDEEFRRFMQADLDKWAKLVKEGDLDWRKSWMYHYNYEKQFPYTPNVRGVRTQQWKYIRYPGETDTLDDTGVFETPEYLLQGDRTARGSAIAVRRSRNS